MSERVGWVAQLGKYRHHPFVIAWISEFQKDFLYKYDDCDYCGFPHAKNLLCNGAPFGILHIGKDKYSVDISNLEYFIQFREKVRKGFHWQNDTYFSRAEDGSVLITSFWQYNNYPQEQNWKIDENSWASIVSSVSATGETSESWLHIKEFHAAKESAQ